MQLLKISFYLIIFFISSNTLQADQVINPEKACQYLSDERFRGNLDYKPVKKSEVYSCASLRKPVDKGEPSTSDLRYAVKGTQNSADQISLLLRMNSFKVSVPVLKEFIRVTEIIYSKAFDMNLPEDIKKSMLSAKAGEWQHNGYTIKLLRQFDKTRTYELVFIIES